MAHELPNCAPNVREAIRFVERNGWEWDETFRSTLSMPKMDGRHCFTGRILGEFSFRLTLLEQLVPHP
ncbi:hypothetical protein DVH24_024395 [Malus domestica]|uniref:Uncharacterized protein n=1 Tax=Malus domestica TaxID=3750 RepID=A0A498JN11_MALDO|nr:hypothetical protein DVH24_024395 [Malus domestica]